MSECDPTPRRKSRRAQRLAAHTRACLLWGGAFFAVAQCRSADRHARTLAAVARSGVRLQAERPASANRGRTGSPPARFPGFIAHRTGDAAGRRAHAYRRRKGGRLLTYNFSQVGSGPLGELVCLRRLLDAGIRPNFLAIEVLPPLLGRKTDAVGDPKVGVSRLTWNDVSPAAPLWAAAVGPGTPLVSGTVGAVARSSFFDYEPLRLQLASVAAAAGSLESAGCARLVGPRTGHGCPREKSSRAGSGAADLCRRN